MTNWPLFLNTKLDNPTDNTIQSATDGLQCHWLKPLNTAQTQFNKGCICARPVQRVDPAAARTEAGEEARVERTAERSGEPDGTDEPTRPTSAARLESRSGERQNGVWGGGIPPRGITSGPVTRHSSGRSVRGCPARQGAGSLSTGTRSDNKL